METSPPNRYKLHEKQRRLNFQQFAQPFNRAAMRPFGAAMRAGRLNSLETPVMSTCPPGQLATWLGRDPFAMALAQPRLRPTT